MATNTRVGYKELTPSQLSQREDDLKEAHSIQSDKIDLQEATTVYFF